MSSARRRGVSLRPLIPVFVCTLLLTALVTAQKQRDALTVGGRSVSELRQWDQRIDRMVRDGDLRLRQRRDDTLIEGRTIERLDQYHRGVRVVGADISRQLAGPLTISTYGTLFEGIDVDTSPGIDAAAARATVEQRAGISLGAGADPELTVLPQDDGRFILAWHMRAVTATGDVRMYFVDARTGSMALEYSDLKTQYQLGSIGTAQGVLGDTKKISVTQESGRFSTVDRRRPPAITTYDLAGNPTRTIVYLNFRTGLSASDIAGDPDNNWTDGAIGDAHIYAGWTYDYYFKQFGRRGLDNANIAIVSLVHPVRRADFSIPYYNQYPSFFANAAYYGAGVMMYGDGLPPNVTIGGQVMDYFSGSLDVVAHELTHGVTDYTSDLIYRNESGALNEAFSDIMGTSIEFYFQPAGNGSMRADYLLGEDIARPGGFRSMSDPLSYGDPDHYSRRYLGASDNGGVHTNSSIANQAFYLAIEGGTNRTSGLSVQGVGAANRAQIEKVFYRAFTQLMTSTATFSTAYAATVQAARDLYGAGSGPERAVIQAWTAVGVQQLTASSLTGTPLTPVSTRMLRTTMPGWPAVGLDVRGQPSRALIVAQSLGGLR